MRRGVPTRVATKTCTMPKKRERFKTHGGGESQVRFVIGYARKRGGGGGWEPPPVPGARGEKGSEGCPEFREALEGPVRYRGQGKTQVKKNQVRSA